MNGWGNMDYGSQVASEAECAAACDARAGCGSFEWSATRYANNENCCNLNTQSTVDSGSAAYLDFIFCAKDASPRAYTPPSPPPLPPQYKWHLGGANFPFSPGTNIEYTGKEVHGYTYTVMECYNLCVNSTDCCGYVYFKDQGCIRALRTFSSQP